MNAELRTNAAILMSAATRHGSAGETNEAIDSAVHAHVVAESDDARTQAAVAVATWLDAKGLPADVIGWCDRVLDQPPGHPTDPARTDQARIALALRGSAHLALGRPAQAMADLDAAVAEATIAEAPAELEAAVPGRVRLIRARALAQIGRSDEARSELDRVVDDPEEGAGALRTRGNLRLAAGDRAGGCADLAAAARAGDLDAVGILADEGALPEEGASPEDAGILATRVRQLRRTDAGTAAAELADRLLGGGALPPARRDAVRVDRAYLGDGGWPEIAERLAPVAADRPEDADVLTRYGRALYQADRDDEAAAVLERAVALAPGTGVPERYLGDVHAYAQRWEVARGWYERAMVLAPHAPAAQYGLALTVSRLSGVDDARSLMLRAAIGGAEEAAQWCKDQEETLPDERFETATWLIDTMRNPFSAAPCFRDAARIWRIHSYGRGDFSARHAALALTNAAVCLSQLDDHAQAETLAREALALRPELADGWNNLGNILVHRGRLDEALAAYDRCAWWDPDYAGAPYGRSDVLRRLGRAADAIAALDTAIAIGYRDAARQADLFYRRARLHQAQGDWEAAREDYGAADVEFATEAVEQIQRLLAPAPAGDDEPGPDEPPDLAEPPEPLDTAETDGCLAPYRTYGLTVIDEDEGRVEWAYRIQFRDPPDAAARESIALAAMSSIGETYLEQERPWLWSDRFALMRLTLVDTALGEELPNLVGPAISAINAVVPVVEVVSFAAKAVDEYDDQEVWSIRRQPVPDAGPEFPDRLEFWAPRIGDTTTFPEPAQDPAFEQAFWNVAAAKARQAIDRRATQTAQLRAAGQILLVTVDPEEVPAAAPVRDIGPLRRDPSDWGRFEPDGSGYIQRRFEGYYTGLDQVRADGTVVELIPAEGPGPAMARHIHAVALAPDGSHLVYAGALGHELCSVDLATRAVVKLVDGQLPTVESLAFLDGGQLMVKTETWLGVFDFDGTARGFELVARVPTGLGPAYRWGGGRVLIAGGVDAPQLVVFGYCRGQLHRIAELSADVNCYSVWEAGGRVFASRAVTFEVVNLEPAWSRYAAWVDSRGAPADGERPGAGLVVRELCVQPYSGVNDGPAAVRAVTQWCVRGFSGLILAGRPAPDGEGWELLAGDEAGVHPFTPPVTGSDLEYEWEPAGGPTVLFGHKWGGPVVEADLTTWTARVVQDGPSERACYTDTGHAAVIGHELVVYRWAHGSGTAVEAYRVRLRGKHAMLGTVADGRVIYLSGAGRTAFFWVADDGLRPLGAIAGDDWFGGWMEYGDPAPSDGAMILATNDARAFRITGFHAAIEAARDLAPLTKLKVKRQPLIGPDPRVDYPDRTRWSLP